MRVNIRLVLDGKDATEFNQVKEELGIENNTDVLRFLIRHPPKITTKPKTETPLEAPAQ